MRAARVVCLGHAALDRVYQVERLPTGPTKMGASAYREVGGGMAANAACAIARLGGAVEFWGRAGDDAAGAIIAREFAGWGVDTTHFRLLAGHASSQSAVVVDATGERLVVNFRGDLPAEDMSWLPFARLAGAGVALVDVRWREGALALLGHARRLAVPTVLDADLGEREAVDALVHAAGHVVFSEPGLERWFGRADRQAGLAAARAAGARVAGVTCGGEGSWWLLDGPVCHVPPFPVAAVDTLGAGDVFHGAYALALAEGRPVLEAARFASAAAAIKCTRPGGRAGSPTRAEVDRLLASG